MKIDINTPDFCPDNCPHYKEGDVIDVTCYSDHYSRYVRTCQNQEICKYARTLEGEKDMEESGS